MDTTLVTIRRIISGRRIDQGGRDHTSHRLVALGLTERGAVLFLYALCAMWSGSVFLMTWMDTGAILLVLLILSIFTVVFTLYLGSIRVYSEPEEQLAMLRSRGENVKAITGVRFLLMNKKLILGLVIDMMIVSVSFLVAARTTQVDLHSDYRFFAILIFIRLLFFYQFDLYNRVWRYVATHELLSHLYAVLLSSFVLFMLNRYFLFGPSLTNSFFLTDFFITLTGLIFSRMIWRTLREYFFRFSSKPKRKTLIYGAGDAGYILIREIIQNNRFEMFPVGFIDDDSAKRNMSIAGIRILGGLDDFPAAVQKTGAEVVVASMRNLDEERKAQLTSMAEKLGVEFKRFDIRII
jgi:UDP-GlcNAc:undecaprenyl-phosphate GlcNAc-1-phosphate transferase